MRALLGFGLSLLTALTLAPAALASPVATDEGSYSALGRVFPDPLGGCQNLGSSPCDPAAEGNNPAVSFIGVNEFRDALAYMNTKPEWQRYMEVLILDGKDGEGFNDRATVDSDPAQMFPGDQLKPEFTPKEGNVSAGLPTTGLGRQKSDLTIVRVTDEAIPDAGKRRMTLSLSIHGIERAGVEGGTRAMEDFVTAATSGRSDTPILPEAVRKGAPSFATVLRNTVIYFTYPNPDGWRRGTIDTGGFGSSFQRYNGNGVDPNRDYTDIGYNFRGYSGGSEPETRAFKGFYRDVLGTGATFQAGDDLHGQPFADALSYTLLPHGEHDLAKDTRIRETAKVINRAQYEATKWNPRIKENDEVSAPQSDCGDSPAGTVCPQIFAQTWGSVYDTINYTTTGTLGDWFDSSEGLSADGIDNEMSFSHIDKQIRFEQDTEQLHVAGNKSIIFAHLADILAPKTGAMDVPGPQGYVPNERMTRAESATTFAPPADTEPQPDIANATAIPDPAEGGSAVYEFTVERTNPSAGTPGIFDGGMRVQATNLNFQGVSTGAVGLAVQCLHCDDHVGAKDAAQDEWVTVAEDYNQSPIYAQAGAVAAVNLPDALYTDESGKEQKVQWRALVSTLGTGLANPGPSRIDIDFSSGPATDDGNTGGDEAPVLGAYDVANTDFFDDLNRYIPEEADRFQKISPKQVITGQKSLDGLHTLVLADELLPGYEKADGGPGGPGGPPTADKEFAGTVGHVPGQGVDGCTRDSTTTDQFDFTIAANEDNASMAVHIEWFELITDWDLHVQKKKSDGTYGDIGQSEQSATTEEDVVVQNPAPGDYRVESVFCSGDPTDTFSGTVKFTGRSARAAARRAAVHREAAPDSLYTDAERQAWIDALKAYAAGGGNLVLTDKALNALPDLGTGIEANKINRQTVYVGQVAVTRCKGNEYDADGACVEEERTLDDPLLENLNQPGSRFNNGFRRQMYESTPLGYAIQDETGSDAANARQYDIEAKAFTDAGGRVAATSADESPRDTAAVTNRVTIGEIPVGTNGGHIRVAGALLPQPTDEFDHPLGLTSYAVTYSGYIVACDLLDAGCSVKDAPNKLIEAPPATTTSAPAGAPGPDFGLAALCASRTGFRKARVIPNGRGLKFRFTRRVKRPVTVAVFQTTRGRKIIGNHRVARFTKRTRSFAWNGASARRDGLYFARLRIRGAKGAVDVRRFSLRRVKGAFRRAPSGYRRAQCSLLRAFKLRFGAFGGRRNTPLGISFRLKRRAKVSLTVSRRGGPLVKRFPTRRLKGNRRYGLKLSAAGLERGDYLVRLTAKRGKKVVRARLVARRL